MTISRHYWSLACWPVIYQRETWWWWCPISMVMCGHLLLDTVHSTPQHHVTAPYQHWPILTHTLCHLAHAWWSSWTNHAFPPLSTSHFQTLPVSECFHTDKMSVPVSLKCIQRYHLRTHVKLISLCWTGLFVIVYFTPQIGKASARLLAQLPLYCFSQFWEVFICVWIMFIHLYYPYLSIHLREIYLFMCFKYNEQAQH